MTQFRITDKRELSGAEYCRCREPSEFVSIFRGHSLSSAVEGEGRRSFYALARLARAASPRSSAGSARRSSFLRRAWSLRACGAISWAVSGIYESKGNQRTYYLENFHQISKYPQLFLTILKKTLPRPLSVSLASVNGYPHFGLSLSLLISFRGVSRFSVFDFRPCIRGLFNRILSSPSTEESLEQRNCKNLCGHYDA